MIYLSALIQALKLIEVLTMSLKKHSSGCCSRLTFWDASSLFNSDVNHEQLWDIDEDTNTQYVYHQAAQYWKQEKLSPTPSLFRVLRRVLWRDWLKLMCLLVINIITGLTGPLLIPYILTFLQTPLSDIQLWHGFLYIGIIFASSTIGSFIYYHAQWLAYRIGIKIRGILTSFIYKKILKSGNTNSESGKITNLIANDAQFMLDTIVMFQTGLLAPLQAIFATILIAVQLGWVSVIPLVLMILLVPYSFYMGRRSKESRSRQQQHTDVRVKYTREFISNIRTLKYYIWEKLFAKHVHSLRESELGQIKQLLWIRIQLLFVVSNTPVFAMGLTFLIYGSINTLEISKVFVAVSLFNMLRQPFTIFPLAISLGTQYKVNIDRILTFLTAPCQSVTIDNITPSLLEHLQPGTCTMVLGRVGSGKTTFLKQIISSMQNPKNAVLVSQSPWLTQGTIRDNILMGNEYIESMYESIVDMCCLRVDFENMKYGDLSEVGERGANLSGGQKQRISLARALYANRDIYLLDDILSALDVNVSQHIFEEVVVKYLLTKCKKTVVLVTNQHSLVKTLSKHSYIVWINSGRIEYNGTFKDLSVNCSEFKQLMQDVSTVTVTTLKSKATSNTKEICKKVQASRNDEEINTENLSLRMYWTYIRYGGIRLFIPFVTFYLLRIAIRVYGSLWLSWWSVTPNIYSFHTWMSIYAAIIIGEIVTVGFAYILSIFWNTNASRTIHRKVIDSFSQTTISWYENTPIGRILTRLVKDVQVTDLQLPQNTEQSLNSLTNLVSILIQVALSNVAIIVIVIITLCIYLVLFLRFRKISIIIQRQDSVSRAPVLSHVIQTIEGIDTIKNYGYQQQMLQQYMEKMDYNTVDVLGLRYCSCWFGLRLNWCSILIIVLTYSTVLLSKLFTEDAAIYSLAAIALSATVPLTSSISSVSSNIIQLERKMNSFERLVEYEPLPHEYIEDSVQIKRKRSTDYESLIDEQIDDPIPEGEIIFNNVYASYSKDKLPFVLHNINLKIAPKEKIGIVGRTGSGKSTLTTLLFRMMDHVQGQIYIGNNIDINTLPLHALRRHISILPQTPTLFTGTVRYNLDPMDEYTDDELYQVLEIVQLKQVVGNLQDKLYTKVDNENNEIFSTGQKQLLALARILLRQSPIWILDEATSSIDIPTEKLIQEVLHKYCADKTILTIAHRLDNIMNSDRVIVIDNGYIIECDTPENLLKQDTGHFKQMVHAAGIKYDPLNV